MTAGEAHGIHGTLLSLGSRPLDTIDGDFTAHLFENLECRQPVIAVALGDVRDDEPLLARVHSSCVTSEAYGGVDCDCAGQLRGALAEIARAGRGVVFYLMQEGRGAGFAAKARDRMLVQASGQRLTTFEAYREMGLGKDLRRYDEVGFACRLLGIRAPLRLMSNNPEKAAALAAAGAHVAELRRLPSLDSPFNLHYLESKRRSGHALEEDSNGTAAAELPEPVERFEPYALPDAPDLVHMASYLLPVRAAEHEVAWLRVHVYFDSASGRERVVLTFGDVRRRIPLVYLHEEDLFDRFPLRRPGTARRLWSAALCRMIAHGAGCAVFLNAEGLHGAIADLESLTALVVHHLPARHAHPVIDRKSGDAAFCDVLLAQGVTIGRRVLLDEP
ncbi:MAG: GTP cyclohydrolase II [Candidatus Binatia bacterium]